MALYDMLKSAQDYDEGSQLALIIQFSPLLKKYAYRLNTEDAYEMLLLDFFELFMGMDIDGMRETSDGAFVKYFENSVRNAYIKHLKRIMNDRNTILIDDQSDIQRFYAMKEQAIYDDLFEVEYSDFFDCLTPKETEVLISMYINGYSAAHISRIYEVSRQNVNQIKLKALNKLKKSFP